MFTRVACVLVVILLTNAGADDLVRSAQEELRRRNLYFGDVDGRQSPELQEALKKYQKRKGFSASGREDPDTLRSLGLSPRSPNEPRPKEFEWPEEPVLKSDRKVDMVQEASELASTSCISAETLQPGPVK